MKGYKQLTVGFVVATAKEVLGTATVLGSLTLRSAGRVVLDKRFLVGEEPTGLPAEVAGRVSELLRRSRAGDGSDKCVLFQHLRVEEVPVCEVVYEYRGPPERRLWIYGPGRLLYAPQAPRPWGKIGLLGVGLLLAAAGAVWAVLLLS